MNEELINEVINNVKEEGVELIDTVNPETVVTEYGETPVHEEEIQPVLDEIIEEKSIEE